MANTIDQAFIKQFESEVHMAYQRMGSKLRNTTRTVANVRGSTVRFQKIGTGTASTKAKWYGYSYGAEKPYKCRSYYV